VILPVIGFDFLRPRAKPAASLAPPAAEADVVQSRSPVELVLTNSRHGYKARAIEADGEITVLAGLTATTKSDFATNNYAALRDQLMRDGRLVPSDSPNHLQFSEDVTFASPSAAAAVISNRNTNGRFEWKLAATGQSLKEWQDAQLGE
jgi:hypothetical protein